MDLSVAKPAVLTDWGHGRACTVQVSMIIGCFREGETGRQAARRILAQCKSASPAP